MPRSIALIRTLAAQQQHFRCFYCNLPMWEASPKEFASAYQLTLSQAKLLQCTAEHLNARCDGGKDSSDNIVAACKYCNHSRHKSPKPLDPEKYRKHVRRRMSHGRWLAAMFKEACPAVS